MDQRSSNIKCGLLLIVLLPLTILSRESLRTHAAAIVVDDSQPPLYLPNQKYVRLITLGFDSFASDLLWFTTINYFGKQYRGNRDYRWLDQMCHLVTDLDPKAIHVYEFCSSMLTWETKDIDKSDAMLSKGISAHPDDWRLWYMRGFNAWYFREDLQRAQNDIQKAASLANAPSFLASLASRMMVETAAPETAISFLSDMVKRASDPRSKEALNDKLKRAFLAQHLSFLSEATRRFKRKYSRNPTQLQELITGGIITAIPIEPFGGEYGLTPAGDGVISTSGEAPLRFTGKTAKTGIAKHETN